MFSAIGRRCDAARLRTAPSMARRHRDRPWAWPQALLLAIGLLLMPCSEAAAADGDRRPVSRWAYAYAYGTATAAEPAYDNAELWPMLTGTEAFRATAWPQTRTLAWAAPGTSGGEKGLNPLDPKNWIDLATGASPTALFDASTDLVFPASDKPYSVDLQDPGHGNTSRGLKVSMRHVTVGANATFRTYVAHVHGNAWVQRDGCLMIDSTVHFMGANHTFYRNDNSRNTPFNADFSKTYLAQYLMFDKAQPDASTEFIGQFHTVDEFQVVCGTLIVGPDSVAEMGREAYPYIEKQGTIALMDGAFLGKWVIDLHACDLQIRGGALQAGLPQRPVARSATFGLGYKNHTNAVFNGPGDPGKRKTTRVVGMHVARGGVLRSYSAPASDATLVIAALDPAYAVTFKRHPLWEPATDRGAPELWAWLDALPKGLDIALLAGSVVDGVRFEGFRPGGIMLEDSAQRQTWKRYAVTDAANKAADDTTPFASLPARLLRGQEY